MNAPEIVVLVSGKRKCGKDFIAEKLLKILGGEKCAIIRISEPIKSYWAEKNNISLSKLLSAAEYKEKYRKAMIEWSDEVRNIDPGYFCKAACDKAPSKEIWIVSDVRRKTDVDWFKNAYGGKVKTVRITADNEVRVNRGWKFTEGVDDIVSECGLDDFENWDLQIENNTEEDGNCVIEKFLDIIKHSISN